MSLQTISNSAISALSINCSGVTNGIKVRLLSISMRSCRIKISTTSTTSYKQKSYLNNNIPKHTKTNSTKQYAQKNASAANQSDLHMFSPYRRCSLPTEISFFVGKGAVVFGPTLAKGASTVPRFPSRGADAVNIWISKGDMLIIAKKRGITNHNNLRAFPHGYCILYIWYW